MKTPAETHEKADFSAEDNFEVLCEQGRILAQNMDENRFAIGDLALQVKKVYRRNTIEAFAVAIGVPKARVQEYRQVCKFWSKSEREQIFDAYAGSVNYTHLRTAMRLRDKAAALEFVRECGDSSYTPELASVKMSERQGKPVAPPKILDGLGLVIGLRGDIVTLRVDSELTTALYDAMRARTPVSIVIRPSEETPDFKPAPAVILGSGYDPRRVDTRLVFTREEATG